MEKKYRVRELEHEDLLEDLLHARGIAPENAERFLAPDFERDSHDPFLLPDMEKAVERILFAKNNNEKICVWSDYDADGIPGGVMLAQFLRDIGMPVRHYIPHRHKEGYGLNEEGIAELAAEKTTLIITVDLGTTEHNGVVFAKEKNIDVIVTDHHVVTMEKQVETSIAQRVVCRPGTASKANFQQEIMRVRRDFVLPEALAVINPKRPDSKYPFDGLCGAGVAWKLVQAILIKLRESGRPFDYAQGKEKWFLDLVGMATLSDMVPLVGENRMLASFGLAVLRKNRRPGIAALLKLLRITPSALTEDDVGFMLSPRINAASRMDSPEVAARLLAASAEEAGELARTLDHINNERKGVVAATVKEANKRLAGLTPSPIIVMGSPEWRPGVLGLVASSLAEAHGKTVFLWGRDGSTSLSIGGDSVIRGSCRSSGGLNVVEMMRGAGDVFEHFGGHHGAGGFSLTQEKVHDLPHRLSDVFNSLPAIAAAEQEIVIDRTLDIAEVARARGELRKLAPFGEGNRKPLFLFPRVSVSGARTFGKTQNHLELQFEKGPSTSLRVNGVAFFSTLNSFQKQVSVGERGDVVGHVESDWRGNPRLRIVDII